MKQITTADLIVKTCDELKELLLDKNLKYGDAVHQSGPLFDIDPVIGIQSRINDKLRRIQNSGLTKDTEDSLTDLMGYFVHLKIAINRKKETPIY